MSCDRDGQVARYGVQVLDQISHCDRSGASVYLAHFMGLPGVDSRGPRCHQSVRDRTLGPARRPSRGGAERVEAYGLQQAAAAIANVTPAQASALCIQTWERMAQKAITAGVPLYTSPCSAGGASVIVGK